MTGMLHKQDRHQHGAGVNEWGRSRRVTGSSERKGRAGPHRAWQVGSLWHCRNSSRELTSVLEMTVAVELRKDSGRDGGGRDWKEEDREKGSWRYRTAWQGQQRSAQKGSCSWFTLNE